MRAQVMRPASLAAVALAATLAAAGPSAAAGHRTAPFRILFAHGASAPYRAGDHGESNRRAVRHVARMLANWGRHPGIRFVFVADRRGACGGAVDCNTEHLLWQRVNATAVLLRTEAARYTTPFRFDRLGQAFRDEFRRTVTLSEAPPGTSSIDLRTLIDAGSPAGGGCPWRVLLFDPDLPPVLGEVDGRPVIPVRADASVAVSEAAMLRVVGSARRAGPALAVWENGSRAFAAAPSSVRSPHGAALPLTPVHLHLLATPAGDAEVKRFKAELTSEFQGIRPPTSLRGRRIARGKRRAMGDDVQRLPPGGLEPPHARLAEAVYCQFTFLPASAPVDGRAR